MGTLIVQQSTGHQFPLAFSVSDSILDIKERILMQFGIPVANQVLSFPGVGAVADGVNILSACLSLGRFHILLTVNIQLVVHVSDTGDQLPLQYDVAAPIGPLKQIIATIRDVPVDQLHLYIGNVRIHDDNSTLAGYGVNGPSVELHVFVGDELTIRNRRDQTHFKVRQILTESVLALKKNIEKDFGISFNRLKLYHGDQQLLDGMSLVSCGVAAGSVIEVQIMIQLTIDLPLDVVNSIDDSMFSVIQDDTEPVGRLKERIWEHAGIPTGHLVLFLDMHEIQDDKALCSYKARDGSVVKVMVHRGPGRQIKLTIRIVDGGRQYSMDQDVTLPISRLRKRIGDIVRVPMDRLTLSLSNGTKLEDMNTLADHVDGQAQVTVDVTVKRLLKNLKIKIASCRREFTVQHDDTTPFCMLKEIIANSEGIPVTRLMLFIGKYQLEDEKTLLDSNYMSAVNDSLVVNVVIKLLKVNLRFKVQGSNREFSQLLDDSMRIRSIKDIIRKSEHVLSDQIDLSIDGRELAADKPLFHYKVSNNSAVDVKILALLRIKMEDQRKPISIPHDKAITVIQLKEMIENMCFTPADMIRLFSGNTELRNDQPLASYNLPEDSELIALLSKIQLTVVSHCGSKTTTMEVKANEKVRRLRAELHKKKDFHVPTEFLLVHHEKGAMKDELAFYSYEVKSGDTIQIQLVDAAGDSDPGDRGKRIAAGDSDPGGRGKRLKQS